MKCFNKIDRETFVLILQECEYLVIFRTYWTEIFEIKHHFEPYLCEIKLGISHFLEQGMNKVDVMDSERKRNHPDGRYYFEITDFMDMDINQIKGLTKEEFWKEYLAYFI